MKKTAIGIDIGGTRTKIGWVDLSAGLVMETVIVDTESKSEQVFLSRINVAIDGLKFKAKIEKVEIIGIGFGIPGFVFEDGKIDSTYGFLEFMEDYPLKQIIEDKHQLPCLLDNDARLVALGEALYGEGRNYDRVLVLTLGTGLGVGFTKAGKLNELLPYAHMAGHLTISDVDVLCYCGKTGCLEALVSATGLCKAVKDAEWKYFDHDEDITAEALFFARSQNEPVAITLIEDYIGYLKKGIDNYVNVFAPDVIVIGGGVAKGLENDLHKLHDSSLLNPYKSYKTKIVASKLQEHAGILGSAALFN